MNSHAMCNCIVHAFELPDNHQSPVLKTATNMAAAEDVSSDLVSSQL
jgi:hypothetical protein